MLFADAEKLHKTGENHVDHYSRYSRRRSWDTVFAHDKSPAQGYVTYSGQAYIQYIVEEAISAGIESILIITGRDKRNIEDHFDKSFELEQELKRQNIFAQHV